jgi:DNA recombination protein RmuC
MDTSWPPHGFADLVVGLPVTEPASTGLAIAGVAAVVLAVVGMAGALVVLTRRLATAGDGPTRTELASAHLEAQRAADREETARVLRTVVAEHGTTVDAAVRAVLDLAGDKLEGTVAAGVHGFDLRHRAIDQQVEAVTGELARTRELVESLRSQQATQHGAVAQALSETAARHRDLHDTTRALHDALASPKARGQWGERMADDVLSACGLVEGLNYRRQTAVAGGTIPDVTFLMPAGRVMHMDVKFPLDNYVRHLEAPPGPDADRHRDAFLRDVRARIRELATRGYLDGDDTVDCVLLFIPNEAVYSFVHQHDPSLTDHALAQRVVLCSPFTLFAVLGVVRQAMDNFLLEQTSDEILRSLGGLGAEWQRCCEQIDKVGRAVESLQRSYDGLAGTRRRAMDRRLDEIEGLRHRAVPARRADGDVGDGSDGNVAGNVGDNGNGDGDSSGDGDCGDGDVDGGEAPGPDPSGQRSPATASS